MFANYIIVSNVWIGNFSNRLGVDFHLGFFDTLTGNLFEYMINL